MLLEDFLVELQGELLQEKKPPKISDEEKEEWEEMFGLIKDHIIDKFDLEVDKEPKSVKSKEFIVRGKKGNPRRHEYRNKIFDELPEAIKEKGPEKGSGGKTSSKSAPNINFPGGWNVVFKPTIGTKKIGADRYEEAIVSAWNRIKDTGGDLYNPPEAFIEVGEKIVDQLEDEIKGNPKGEWLGKFTMPDVSKFWKLHTTRADKTPKTDLTIGDYRISLKMGSQAQLASPKVVKAEGEALFFAAAEQANLGKDVLDDIQSYFELDEEGISKLGRSNKEIEERGEEYFKVNQKELTDKIRALIASDEDFRYYFVLESMTGNIKFHGAPQSDRGIASHILVADFTGDEIQFHDIQKPYVKHIADQINVYVSWKSAGGNKYATFRVTGPEVKFENKSIYDVFQESSEQPLGVVKIPISRIDEYAAELGITDNRLDEGIKDAWRWATNKVSKIMEKGMYHFFKLFNLQVKDIAVDGNDTVDFWR